MAVSYHQVLAVKNEHAGNLMQVPGVIGVGIGRNGSEGLVIRLLLQAGDMVARDQLPQALDGIPVVTEIVGNIVAAEPATREQGSTPPTATRD